jgi:alpha-amylase
MKDWTSGIVEKYGFDGMRFDTAMEIPVGFWTEIAHNLPTTFTFGEAFNGDSTKISTYANNAFDAILSYPMFYTIKDVYGSGKSAYGVRNRLAEYKTNF